MRLKTQAAGVLAALAMMMTGATFAIGGLFDIEEEGPTEPTLRDQRRQKMYVPGPLPAGKTFATSGECYYKRRPTNPWKKDTQPIPRLGLELFEEDVLTTVKGRMYLGLKDDTFIEIAEHSEIRIERSRPGATEGGDHVIEFRKGILHLSVAKFRPRERYSVRTEGGAFRLKGPVDLYLVQYPGRRDFVIHVIQGEVELYSALTGDRLTIGNGAGAELKVSGVVKPLGTATPALVEALKARVSI